jgi:hypothetical protein
MGLDRSSKQTEAIENAFMSDEASSPALSHQRERN